MSREPLSRDDTEVLKGLGILLIVVHNFQYLASALPGVNEFAFDVANARAFFEGTTLASLPRILFAFFGHYGVQLFTFASAYGLTLSFERRQPGYRDFLVARLRRLYPSFLIALVLWAAVKALLAGPDAVTTQLGSIALKLTLLFNLVPGEQLSLVGPWWFLPFIVQFYVVFPLLRRLDGRGLVVVSVASFALAWGLDALLLPPGFIYATPLGHLPEFCIGIWFARRGHAHVPVAVTAAALVVLLAGQLDATAWRFTHLAALLFLLGTWHLAPRAPLKWLGGLSMQLFLVNGFLRAPFFEWARSSEWAAVGWGALQFALCVVVALTVRHVAGERRE